jgi:glycosyltransferase involved in cell wall biosynthesis
MLQRLGGGWLVSPDNVDDITEKLRWIFTNREESARIGKEAWPAVLQHADIRIMARQTIDLLKDLHSA